MNSKDAFQLYMSGWRDGASLKPMCEKAANHEPYLRGYKDGWDARSIATQMAQTLYCESPSKLPNNTDPFTVIDWNQRLK